MLEYGDRKGLHMLFETISMVLVIVLIVVIYLFRRTKSHVNFLESIVKDLHFDKKSMSVKYGKMTEQFIPFMGSYPYNSQHFRFLGSPIDGVQFEDDKVIFVEFKTGDSRLSAKQEMIKKLVEDKKVEFREIRVK